jgi:hypothetical protein
MGYRGFRNYETFAIAEWYQLDTKAARSDNKERDKWFEMASWALEENDTYDATVRELARRLSAHLQDQVLDRGAWNQMPSFARDLMGNAFKRVDWEEIAELILSDDQFDIPDRPADDDDEEDDDDGEDDDDDDRDDNDRD